MTSTPRSTGIFVPGQSIPHRNRKPNARVGRGRRGHLGQASTFTEQGYKVAINSSRRNGRRSKTEGSCTRKARGLIRVVLVGTLSASEKKLSEAELNEADRRRGQTSRMGESLKLYKPAGHPARLVRPVKHSSWQAKFTYCPVLHSRC